MAGGRLSGKYINQKPNNARYTLWPSRFSRHHTERGESAIEIFGAGNASEIPGMSLLPSDPIGIIFIASLTLIILSAIWMGGSNND